MTTGAPLRRRPAELINRRFSIGRDSARLKPSNNHQIEPATALLNHHLDHQSVLLFSASHIIDRRKAHHTRQPVTVPSVKST
jgi:hypothetical protein